MSTVLKKKPVDPLRRSLYAKINIGRKEVAGLADDDTYRDLLDVRYGERSLTLLNKSQLVDMVEFLKAQGFKPKKKVPARAGRKTLADGKTQKKIRALWLSLYHLGVVNNPTEAAIGRYVKRQAGVDDLKWLRPDDAYKVIEALKSWATRAAHVDWSPYKIHMQPDVYIPRARVMEAQWRILHQMGVMRIGDLGALSGWVKKLINAPCEMHHSQIGDADADRVIEALGAKIWQAK